VIKACGGPDYQTRLAKELGEIRDSEMWRAGAAVRALRPAEKARAVSARTKGVAGRKY
jgi:ketol-acid reductoisomerase